MSNLHIIQNILFIFDENKLPIVVEKDLCLMDVRL